MPPALTNSSPLMRRLVVLGIAGAVLVISAVVYGLQANPYAPIQAAASYKPPLSNAAVLQNWLPPQVYSYTIARVDEYLRANRLSATSMTISSAVSTSIPTYNFNVVIEPQDQTLGVQVQVMNFNNILSTAVIINGQLQDTALPTSSPSDSTTVSGVDALVSRGVTANEANNLQAAIQKFNPATTAITIDPTTIEHQIDPDTGTNTYIFTVAINATSYEAKLTCPDGNSVRLLLTDPHSKKQVFDSGTVNSAV